MSENSYQGFDVMLDIETLATTPNAAVTQVGLVAFSFEKGVHPHKRMMLNVAPYEGAEISPSTIRWWMMQSDEARMSVFGPDLPLASEYSACAAIREFFSTLDNPRVWAMPPSFDVVILENMFRRTKQAIPWKYNATRDLRTLADLAGAVKEDRIDPTVAHDALADAVAQALSAVKFYSMLEEKYHG